MAARQTPFTLSEEQQMQAQITFFGAPDHSFFFDPENTMVLPKYANGELVSYIFFPTMIAPCGYMEEHAEFLVNCEDLLRD
jgi:hypothetical protein